MATSRSITRLVSSLVATVLIGLGVIAANAQAALKTWALEGVSPFEFGESAQGFFTLDQTTVQMAPPGPTPVERWHIEITGGTNPQIPNVAFSNTDTGCLVACARFFKDRLNVSILDFRTPLSIDNTYYEFVLIVRARGSALIFPTTEEHIVLSNPNQEPTNIQYNRYLPSNNTVIDITSSRLNSNSSVITTVAAAIPEPETYAMMLAGLGLVGWMAKRRRSGKVARA
jgi:hypothetical protein